ncbi:ankyrin repeat domain-containing protein [Prosthecobacter sp.]|uniref:ankyrin repeat domain-containing protein n=1 Tax=Prosthecobacter sp. TaxID=1965333 RepID=UPI003784C4D0
MIFKRIKSLIFGQKNEEKPTRPTVATCPDCGVGSGELHDLFCTREKCPFCGGQLCTCACIGTVLKLSDDEQRALDECIDDSVPPVSEINQRWKEALRSKGRIPFEAFGNDPIRSAYRGESTALKSFLDAGYPPNAANEVGYTALMAAARGEQCEIIHLLLLRGWTANFPDHRGLTALHWAVAQPASDPKRQVACVTALVDAGADVNACSAEGVSVLMNAAWFGNGHAVKHLLQAGADASHKDTDGRTARDLATTRGHADLAKLLA